MWVSWADYGAGLAHTGIVSVPDEKPVSLAPLKTDEAIKGLFAIPDPDATKPSKPARKKKAPPPAHE